MAIRNVTDEVESLRSANAVQDRIAGMSQERAAFALKALVLAGHVPESTMVRVMDLADTIREFS